MEDVSEELERLVGAGGRRDDDDPALTRAEPPPGGALKMDSILRIPVVMQVIVGSATMPVSNLLKLGRGAVVPLDHRIGEPVDVVVNGRLIARGEVVVIEDDDTRFGVSLTEIIEPGIPGKRD